MFTDFDDYVDDKPYRNPASKKSKDKGKVVKTHQRRTGEYQNVKLDENGFPVKTATLIDGQKVEKVTHRRPQRTLDERRRADKGTHRQESKENQQIYGEAFEDEYD